MAAEVGVFNVLVIWSSTVTILGSEMSMGKSTTFLLSSDADCDTSRLGFDDVRVFFDVETSA